MFCLIGVQRRDQLLALDRLVGMLVQRQGGTGLGQVLIVAQAEVALVARTRNYRVLHRSTGIGLV